MCSTVYFGTLDLNVPQTPQIQCALNTSSNLISQLMPALPLFSNFSSGATIHVGHTKKCGLIFLFSPTTDPLSQQDLLTLVC